MISQADHLIRPTILIVLSVLIVSACATNSGKPDGRDVGYRAAAVALGQLGSPYRYGGSSPDGFDCSGLVQFSYRLTGKSLPRTTTALWNDTKPVGKGDMRPGDILFFKINGKMSHVGLYLGKRRFVHAPSSGRVVSTESLDTKYYSRAFIRAGRPR